MSIGLRWKANNYGVPRSPTWPILVRAAIRYFGNGAQFWLDVQGSRGSASVSPFKVFKELHGSPVDVTPTGAVGREHQFSMSYRSEWAYFLAGVRGEVHLAPPEDQIKLHKVMEAIYRSADEQHDIKL